MSNRLAPRRASALLAIGVLISALAACRTNSADAASSSRLDPSLFEDRFSVGRLAGQTSWRPCVGVDSLGATSLCSAPRLSAKAFDRLASAARLARQRLDSDSSAHALQDAAVLALRLRDSITTGLDDAARLLTRARRIAPTDPAILNDFAVVQLQLGEREQTIRPYLSALDAIERAVVTDSTDARALFNRALILEHLHLLATAQRAWQRYASVERDAGWRRESHVHLALLAREWKSAALPQGGREVVFQLLGDWGHAIAGHDEARAAALLETVHGVVATLDTLHGDQSVRLAVATVDSQVRIAKSSGGKSETLSRLAAAHVDYAEGFLSYRRPLYEDAEVRLARGEQELRALGSAGAGWAELYRAAAELNQGKYDLADQRLQRLIAETSPSQPALAGKAVWTRGVIEVRRGNFESANQYYVAAEPYLTRANEPENEGAISYLISESLSSAGQYAAGHAEAYRGLRLLAAYRKSDFLINHLGTVASYSRADSLPYATLAVMDELLSVALDLGRLDALGLTHRTRARDLAAIGRRDSALAELTTALHAVEPLTGHAKERYRADIQLVQGQIQRTGDPRAALPVLEKVAGEYRRLGVYSKASAALYETAMAARDAGDTVRARGLLGDAIAQIEQQQTTFESSEGRAALFETADKAFDAMIDLELRAGHADSAFAYLERERAAAKLSSAGLGSGGRSADAPSLESLRAHLPTDMVFIEYALLKDRMIAWTASRRGTSHFVIPVPRDTIAQLVQQFLQEMSIPASHDGDARSRLFDLLLRPLAGELAGVEQISVVCDRELSQLPFAALWDHEERRYVVERYRVRTEPSGAFFVAALGAMHARNERRTALVVGNPALDSKAFRLEPLPGAELEARRVAMLYQHPTLLTGAAARRDTVLALLRRPAVFHFAGHAVFNGDRPELSYLAFAAPRVRDMTGALTAREIGELRLSNLEIVVLSACQTLSSRTNRTGGVAGLAFSFLRAGAPAIISTLWDVSDDVTGPLLTSFHQRFAAGAPAADALREAQLEALKPRSGQPAAPALWAAFIYAGS